MGPDGSSGNWALHDASGNKIAVIRKFWTDFEILHAGKVTATTRRVHLGRDKPKYEILLATGTRLMVFTGLTRRKFDVRGAAGEPFLRLERQGFHYTRRNVEVEAGAERVLAFSVIAWITRLQELGMV